MNIKLECHEANHICDKNQYKEATFWEKVRLNIHLIYCRACRKYTRNNKKLSKDERALLKKNSPILKKERAILLILISAVVVSFLFTLFSLLNGLFWEPEYVPADEFERKLEALKSQYTEENQKLEQELDKARLTIDSLQKSSLPTPRR